METSLNQQVIQLIKKSKHILLLTHAKADCDGLGSMISMYLALQKMGKKVIAATNDPTPDNLSFLPSINIVQNSLSAEKDFIITLDISKTPLEKIKYNLEGNQVNIIVTPKQGHFNPQDVSFAKPEKQATPFDLIVSFDTGNLEHLGPIYDQNTDLFFNTPLINIDHHASNTDYGQVNLVDVVAASTTQVVLKLLQEMEKTEKKTFVTEDIATLLLAGLITDTGSFQHANTSPAAMEIAADLLDLGARQQEIIKNIYKTKKLSTLKLWGTVLSKVQSDPIHRMVWSTITQKDLKEADASSDEAEGIIDDLLSNAPGAEIIALIKHNEGDYVSVSMRSTTNSADVGKLCKEMGGGGHVRAAGYKVRDGRGVEEVTQKLLEKVKTYQAERLNLHTNEGKQTKTVEEKKVALQKSNENKMKEPPKKTTEKKRSNQKITPLEFKSPTAKTSEPKPGRQKKKQWKGQKKSLEKRNRP